MFKTDGWVAVRVQPGGVTTLAGTFALIALGFEYVVWEEGSDAVEGSTKSGLYGGVMHYIKKKKEGNQHTQINMTNHSYGHH